MVGVLSRRGVVCVAAGLLVAAFLTSCTGSQGSPGKQQIADLQATIAALETQVSPTKAATTATAIVTAATAPSPVKLLTPPAATPRWILAASLPRIGEAVPVSTDSGEQLTVTVNAIIDSATSTHPFNKAMGRWVVVDWTITNRGSIGHRVSIYAYLLQTTDNYVINVGNAAGLPTPELISSTLGPGQTVRGYVPYDVAAGAKLKSAIYQPLGNRQFVIADLTP